MPFNPKFEIMSPMGARPSPLYIAQIINEPHEPKAVERTCDVIEAVSKYCDASTIGELLIRQAHHHICEWLPDNERGVYRTMPIRIGGEIKDHFTVPQSMSDIHPFCINNRDDLKEWYRLFQEIHPFADGNGRVGGAIIAGVSFALWSIYIVAVEV